jgi:hypothetical protein
MWWTNNRFNRKAGVCVCVCACVHACERERERERETYDKGNPNDRNLLAMTFLNFHHPIQSFLHRRHQSLQNIYYLQHKQHQPSQFPCKNIRYTFNNTILMEFPCLFLLVILPLWYQGLSLPSRYTVSLAFLWEYMFTAFCYWSY